MHLPPPDDIEEDNLEDDQAIQEDPAATVVPDQSNSQDSESDSIDAESEADLLFAYRPLHEKLSTGLAQFELLVQN